MKDLNKILYDILIKISSNQSEFKANRLLIVKYFNSVDNNEQKWEKIEHYLKNFYDFCFELSSNSMIKEVQNYRF